MGGGIEYILSECLVDLKVWKNKAKLEKESLEFLSSDLSEMLCVNEEMGRRLT